jgi:hypothetical protein
MAWTDDDRIMRPVTDGPLVCPCIEPDDIAVMDDSDNMPDDPAVDADEWPADEAGYGYGV